MRLLIPTAKIIPLDLQHIGKLPAIIYPVNDRIAYDFFEEKYRNIVSEIDVLCYEKVSEIQRKLQYHGQGVNLQIIKLEALGDLGHTIYAGLTEAGNPEEDILINFADTIIMDSLPLEKNNFIAYSEQFTDEAWSYFDMSDGEIIRIYDKKKVAGIGKKSLFTGVFKIQNSRFFKYCLDQAFEANNRSMDTFYFALMLYSRKCPFEAFPVKDWFDIGHVKKYFESKLAVREREFNHIHIDKRRGILKKTSENKEKFIKEIEWYLKLPKDIEYVRPRIFSYSLDYENPYVEMEYYSYHTLHELFLYGELTYEQWSEIFTHILFLMDDFNRYGLRDSELEKALEEVYLKKTLQRMQILEKNLNFSELFISPVIVNGTAYKPLKEICKILKQEIPLYLYDIKQFSIIHGDLCFANILVDNNFSFIKLIDPRGSFGQYDLYGDRRYEIAKILHSIEGKYDYIIKDLFKLELLSKTEFYFQIVESEHEFELHELFVRVFKDVIGNDLEKVELIEALLFLSMIPLHSESLRHQYAMLCTGLSLLDKIIDIKI